LFSLRICLQQFGRGNIGRFDCTVVGDRREFSTVPGYPGLTECEAVASRHFFLEDNRTTEVVFLVSFLAGSMLLLNFRALIAAER
jgi:hypothetical protein